MPKLDLDSIEQTSRTGYPPPFNAPMTKRHYRRLAPAAGLEDFGVSHVTLDPGGNSSQRHWHPGEDEFVVMLAGEAAIMAFHHRRVIGRQIAGPAGLFDRVQVELGHFASPRPDARRSA